MEIAYGFVDGAYMREIARAEGKKLCNPFGLCRNVLGLTASQNRDRAATGPEKFRLARVLYFDGLREGEERADDQVLNAYWSALEVQDDTELGWGFVRGEGTRQRQKGVDTLLAVRMLVGAFNRLFKTAVLAAADEDFAPAVDEVRRFGVRLVLGTIDSKSSRVSTRLLKACDRRVVLPLSHFPELTHAGRQFDPALPPE